MERRYEKTLGTALLAVGLAILLFAFFQAYEYTQTPPGGTYKIFSLGGTGGGGNGANISGSFNGSFLVAFMFLTIEYLVGAYILKSGWNLITPKAETIQVRVKPRSLQVEPVDASPPPTVAPPVPPEGSMGPSWKEPESSPPSPPS